MTEIPSIDKKKRMTWIKIIVIGLPILLIMGGIVVGFGVYYTVVKRTPSPQPKEDTVGKVGGYHSRNTFGLKNSSQIWRNVL